MKVKYKLGYYNTRPPSQPYIQPCTAQQDETCNMSLKYTVGFPWTDSQTRIKSGLHPFPRLKNQEGGGRG